MLFSVTLGFLAAAEQELLAARDLAELMLAFKSLGKRELDWDDIIRHASEFPSEAHVATARELYQRDPPTAHAPPSTRDAADEADEADEATDAESEREAEQLGEGQLREGQRGAWQRGEARESEEESVSHPEARWRLYAAGARGAGKLIDIFDGILGSLRVRAAAISARVIGEASETDGIAGAPPATVSAASALVDARDAEERLGLELQMARGAVVEKASLRRALGGRDQEDVDIAAIRKEMLPPLKLVETAGATPNLWGHAVSKLRALGAFLPTSPQAVAEHQSRRSSQRG